MASEPLYERTFSVSVPVARAWQAFTEPAELEVWLTNRFETADDAEGFTAASPGGQVGFEVVEAVAEERLRYRQWAGSPDAGIDVTVTFESTAGGTRITMTQAGFGGPSILHSDPVHHGMDETLADLVLYLEHGVRFARHRDLVARSMLLADLHPAAGAVEIGTVPPDSGAGATGLQPGDLVLQLGAGAVFDLSDISFFCREHEPGETVDIVWARGGTVHRGRLRLDARETRVFERSR
jgi:uncharacterized protein YndB with AHSA1/START domain